jgi:hypothetical protein
LKKTISVKGKQRRYSFCPVSYSIYGIRGKNIKLLELDESKEVPVQYDEKEGKIVFIIDNLGKGEERKYLISDEVEAKAMPQQQEEVSGVELVNREDSIDVLVNKELFTTYHFGGGVVRPFLNPVMGPVNVNASVVRELFDKPSLPDHDHIHQRGIFTGHGDINGVDNWHEEGKHGFVKHNTFLELSSGRVFGKIVAENFWTSHEGDTLLTEIRKIVFYNLSMVRIIDFEMTFVAEAERVIFGDTKEGGIIAVRVASSMRGDRGGQIINSYGGLGEGEAWGKRAHWCNYSGMIGSRRVGIAIFDSPNNLRYPTYWHVRNYGLMAANPFALSHYYGNKDINGSYTLEKGKEMKFSYRIFIHQTDKAINSIDIEEEELLRASNAYNNYLVGPEIKELT